MLAQDTTTFVVPSVMERLLLTEATISDKLHHATCSFDAADLAGQLMQTRNRIDRLAARAGLVATETAERIPF